MQVARGPSQPQGTLGIVQVHATFLICNDAGEVLGQHKYSCRLIPSHPPIYPPISTMFGLKLTSIVLLLSLFVAAFAGPVVRSYPSLPQSLISCKHQTPNEVYRRDVRSYPFVFLFLISCSHPPSPRHPTKITAEMYVHTLPSPLRRVILTSSKPPTPNKDYRRDVRPYPFLLFLVSCSRPPSPQHLTKTTAETYVHILSTSSPSCHTHIFQAPDTQQRLPPRCTSIPFHPFSLHRVMLTFSKPPTPNKDYRRDVRPYHFLLSLMPCSHPPSPRHPTKTTVATSSTPAMDTIREQPTNR